MKSFSLVLLLLVLIRTNSYSQEIQENNSYPEFVNSGMAIENLICLDLSEMQYNSLLSTDGTKVTIRTENIIINGDTVKQETISTRGQSTLMYKRKSLHVKLNSKATFRHGEIKKSMKEFLLLNLAMDKYYCRNRLAFEMMDMIGIFNLYFSYCELKINGRSDGVYMILERPEEWALEGKEAPILIRRSGNNRIAETKIGKKTDRTEKKEYVDNFREIYRSLNKYEGEELYRVLLEYIDLDNYMKWLAFNNLVRNGDYSDEVFFYIDPELEKFRIIPWDYDDIFAASPHEGNKKRNRILGDRLIFSCEDHLDRKIATDPYLYNVYQDNLKEVFEELSPEIIKQVIENTYGELYPYFSNEEIICNAQYDHFKDASTLNLRDYLSKIYLILVSNRNNCIKNINTSLL